jgi:hypothetical protein
MFYLRDQQREKEKEGRGTPMAEDGEDSPQ